MGRTSTKSTHSLPITHEASSSRSRPENDTSTAGNEPRRPSSPLPDTNKRGGQARRERQRDERDGRRAAADRSKHEPRPQGRPLRTIRHRHGHERHHHASKQRERVNPAPSHDTSRAGSKAGRGQGEPSTQRRREPADIRGKQARRGSGQAEAGWRGETQTAGSRNKGRKRGSHPHPRRFNQLTADNR